MLKLTDRQGAEHELRFLGYDDLVALGKILDEALEQGSRRLSRRVYAEDLGRMEGLAAAFATGAPHVSQLIADWLASVVGVAPGDLKDPDKFSPATVLQLIKKLGQHEDVQAFFLELVGPDLLEQWQTRMASGLLSIFSSPDTEEPGETG